MPKTILCFDFGTKKIGTATGNDLTQTASPLSLLERPNGKMPWQAISTLIEQWQPNMLLVGLPLHADASENDWSKRCRRFANQLHGRYGLDVELVDERHSSEQAELISREANSKIALDNIAACIILERYWHQYNCN